MAKPLIASTFFSFPKLLLWSIPLLCILVYTYLPGGLIVKLSTLVPFALPAEKVSSTTPIIHDSTFPPHFSLRVTEQPFTQSCITKTEVILINGTSPGPEIRLTEGNIYWIRVYNDIDNKNLTMHWHGLSMAVSPFSDGTPGASQWPIPPNHYFDYEIEIGAGYAGTYFYHSHVGFQAVTAAGPLIIDDTEDVPYEYDDERIIALSDVFEKSDSEVEDGLLGNPFQWSGEPSSVEPNKTYRFRFIGGTALSFVTLAFEGHEEMTLIEADGNYVQPVNITHLQIGSGQRFSVLFKTKGRSDLTKSQFFMQVETRDRPSLIHSYAILDYKLASSKRAPFPILPRLTLPLGNPPITLPPTSLGWLDYKLLSLFPDPNFPLTSEVTRRVTIRTHQIIGNGSVVWAQDDSPWIESFPQEPYLVSLYKNDSIEFPSLDRAYANNGIDPVTRVFPAAIGEVIEIIIQNTGSDLGGVDIHPFHAHGAHYYDLGSGNGTYDPEANEENLKGLNLAKRDTTMLYKYAEKTTPGVDMGWRAWRLRVIQPGVWMIHCHILQHMVMGMQTVWVMGNETEIMNVPYDDIKGYLDYGGDVNGNDTHDPRVVHFKGGDI